MSPVTAALLKMRGAGFSVQVVAGRLRVAPADRLTAVQRQWIAANRDALIVELANDDPHIGDIVATFDATVIRVEPDPTTQQPVSVDQTQTTDTGGTSRRREVVPFGHVCRPDPDHRHWGGLSGLGDASDDRDGSLRGLWSRKPCIAG